MRTLLASVALLLVPQAARADSFVDIFGGVSIPLGDEQWTDTVETSPKLGLRVGAFPQNVGGYLQADWMPVNTDAEGTFPGGQVDVSAHRFRLLVGGVFRHPISNTLAFQGRGGIGADIAYASYEGSFLGAQFEDSESDVGLGFEFGAGFWVRVGSMEVGGEVAFPFAIHGDDEDMGIDYDYTSYDLDLMFGVRFLSR